MLRPAGFFVLLLLTSRPLSGQSIQAVVPTPDYTVYTAVANCFTEADRKGRVLAKPLLLISDYTVVPRPHGFDVDFRNLSSRSLAPFPQTDSPLKTPEWAAFIASVDTSQFTQRRLEKLPKTTGCRAKFWTPALRKYYFAKDSPRPGYYGIQRDYKNFVAIVSFSQVAYSSDGQKALCYYSEVSDGLAGSGSLIFLEKKNGRWQVVDSLMLWIP